MSRRPVRKSYSHGALDLPGRDHQIAHRRDNGELRNQNAAPLDAAIKPHAVSTGVFDLPNGRDPKLRHSYAIDHVHVCTSAVEQKANTISSQGRRKIGEIVPLLFSRAGGTLQPSVRQARGRSNNQTMLRIIFSNSTDIFSPFVACGGAYPCPNQAGGRRFRPVPNGEHLFPSVHQKPEPILQSSRERYGRARQQPSSHSVPASASAPQNSGYRASAIRRTTRSWSFSTRSVGGVGSARSAI
jgi:hypothetical protein